MYADVFIVSNASTLHFVSAHVPLEYLLWIE